MAISSVGNRGTGIAGASASTTVSMAPSATVAVGRVLLATVVSPSTAAHESVTDTGGNGWEKVGESSGNSQTTSVWVSRITTQLSTGSTITATFDSSISDKCIAAWEFSVGAGQTLQTSSPEQTSTGTGTGFGSAAFAGLASAPRLYWRGLGKNANSTTALTATSSFTTAGWTVRSRNNTAARIVRAEFRVNTSTGETSNPTFAVSGNHAGTFVALEEAAVPGAALEASITAGATASGELTVPPASTALGGVDATADILSQQTDLPASLKSAFTVAAFIKRVSNGNEGWVLTLKTASNSVNALYVTTGGELRVGSNLGSEAIGTIDLDTWYFVALTQSGATRQLKGYLAPLGGSKSSATHTSIDDADALTDLLVAGGYYFGTPLNGSITEVRVWTRELTSGELDSERAQRTPASTTDLIGRYPLVDAATKLTASVGTDLVTTGSGAWTTDEAGPVFGATGAALEATVAGSATLSAGLTTGVALAAAASGAGSVAGSLSTAIVLEASASGAASSSGALTTAVTLAGALGAGAVTTAALTTSVALTGALVAGAAVAGELASPAAAELAGSLEATASAGGALTTAIATAGGLSVSAASTGALSTAIALAGGAAATASVSGGLSTALALGAAASCSAGVTGALSTAIRPAASVVGTASSSGALTTAVALAGELVGSLSASGVLQGGAPALAGSLEAQAGASGSLTTDIACAGALAASCSATGALTTALALAGGVGTSSSASAGLATAIALSGSAAATATSSAELTEATTFAGELVAAATMVAGLRIVRPRYAAPTTVASASVGGALAAASVPGRRGVAVTASEATASVTTPTAGATP